jgi:nucleoside-diphosphate kinase
MSKQQTFAMIKPDAVYAGNVGRILSVMESEKFIFKFLTVFQFDEFQATEFYKEHEDKSFFKGLIEFTCSGPAVLVILEGDNVVNRWRELMGATDPTKAAVNSLRNLYGHGMPDNAVHGSDSEESADREVEFVLEMVM